MIRSPRLIVSVLVLPLLAAHAAAQPPTLELKDGDRVAFIGSTFIEREGRFGFIEAALTTRWHDRNITFRNLGWSGDDVTGQSRSYFGPPADGFKHLLTYAAEVKPTVLMVCYGANESFAGSTGLGDFIKGYETLLDELVKATGARVILISPPPHEKLGPPLPDPAAANQNLAIYRDAIAHIAQRRGCGFVDLFGAVTDAKPRPPGPLTDNGVHYNEAGYRFIASLIAPVAIKRVTANDAVQLVHASAHLSDAPYLVKWGDLPAGEYVLKIDGQDIAGAVADQWLAGVMIDQGPEIYQARMLREAIVRKNELFFHGYRPANETYLRGFRKREQGQNAVEIPQFTPLVEKMEETIATLKTPGKHTYELVKVKAVAP